MKQLLDIAFENSRLPPLRDRAKAVELVRRALARFLYPDLEQWLKKEGLVIRNPIVIDRKLEARLGKCEDLTEECDDLIMKLLRGNIVRPVPRTAQPWFTKRNDRGEPLS